MRINKTKLFIGFFIFSFSAQLKAQNIRLDRLEQLFDQGYFQMVHRQSKQLLNDPEFDHSMLPSYYKAITTLELAQQARWKSRHQADFDWAISYLLELKTQRKGQQTETIARIMLGFGQSAREASRDLYTVWRIPQRRSRWN